MSRSAFPMVRGLLTRVGWCFTCFAWSSFRKIQSMPLSGAQRSPLRRLRLGFGRELDAQKSSSLSESGPDDCCG
jgi:hypothetical protein